MRSRTCDCCVSLRVVVALIATSWLCTGAACEELPQESFSRAKTYQELLHTHQVTATATNRESGEREVVRYEQAGDQVVRRNKNRDGSTDAFVQNQAYCFRVISPGEDGMWNIVYVNQQEDGPGSDTHLEQIFRPAYAGARLGFAKQTIWEALKQKHLDVVSINAASDEPNSDVTVKMVRSEKAPDNFRVDSGTFVFSREHYWLIKESNITESFPVGVGRTSGVVRIKNEISFCEPLGLPVISKKSINGVYIGADPTKPPIVLNIEHAYAFDKLTDDEPDRFKLTRFGLPEPR